MQVLERRYLPSPMTWLQSRRDSKFLLAALPQRSPLPEAEQIAGSVAQVAMTKPTHQHHESQLFPIWANRLPVPPGHPSSFPSAPSYVSSAPASNQWLGLSRETASPLTSATNVPHSGVKPYRFRIFQSSYQLRPHELLLQQSYHQRLSSPRRCFPAAPATPRQTPLLQQPRQTLLLRIAPDSPVTADWRHREEDAPVAAPGART